jgi:hypothetical protein
MSRIKLKKHIERCCKKFNKFPIVEILDSVTNYSGYLQDVLHIPAVPNISLYHQFRIYRRTEKDTQHGEVVVQVRTWPGTPTHDKVDFWRGPGDDSGHHVLFPGAKPDFVNDYDKIPGAARATHVIKYPERYEADQLKKEKDLQLLIERFPKNFHAEDVHDLKKLLELENTPVEKDIPPTWTRDRMRKFFSCNHNDGTPNFVASELEEDANLEISVPDVGVVLCELVPNQFYITPPREANEDPFCLCKIKKVCHNKDGIDGAYVQWWEISTAPEDRDYVSDPWHVNAIDSRRRLITDHDWLPVTNFQEEIKMAAMTRYSKFKKKFLLEEGSTDTRPGGGVPRWCIHKHSQKKVRTTVLRFQSEWGDDVIGDHGNVEARFV